jgi:N-acetylated-alpha-linked acidic dipeptidase
MPLVRALGASLAASALLALAPPPSGLTGFTLASAVRERSDEALFLPIPSAAGALEHTRVLALHPRYAGTSGDHEAALYAADRLRDYGFEVRTEQFSSRVDTPRRLVLELYPKGEEYVPADALHRRRGTPPIGLDLREGCVTGDGATCAPAAGLPFDADAADGDVVAPLVYVNRGVPGDFDLLRRAGVEVRGAVVLIREGAAFRGDLVRTAQAAGARGAILYDDPADDGAGRGAAIPDGPWRPNASVERGALGPGVRIPVLPISADNARTLLRHLRGVEGPRGWAGALDAPYPVAKGPAFVHLAVELNRSQETLWNTVGVLPGTDLPRQRVLLAARRDAWVYGADDNGAGTSVVLEAARGLGFLAQSGRLPRRTIVVALWDGDEVGGRGSTDYAEQHAYELRAGTVAYLDVDRTVTGPEFTVAASGTLAPLVADVAREVPDPDAPTASLFARWAAQPEGATVRAADPWAVEGAFARFGTPVVELAFRGPFGPYHSSFDTVRYATTWSDPGFVLHRAAAQLYGLLALRLANADTSEPLASAAAR